MRTDNKIVVIHFTKCTPNSTVASIRIARYLAEFFDCPLLDQSYIEEGQTPWEATYENVIVVNSPTAFSEILHESAAMVERAKCFIWVMNDYMIWPSTQIRRIWDKFHDEGKEIQCWTTVPEFSDRYRQRDTYKYISWPTHIRYVNWNQLTFVRPDVVPAFSERHDGLFYYGSWREYGKQGRAEDFQKYLGRQATYPIHISASSKVSDRFNEMNNKVTLHDILNPLIPGIAQFKATVYIEDLWSHKNYCSPANRFYECLAAETAIFIDKASVGTFEKAGFLVPDSWVVNNHLDVADRLPFAESHMYDQRGMWGATDWKNELRLQLIAVAEKEGLL